MQFYVMGLPVAFIYNYNRLAGLVAALCSIAAVLILRTKLLEQGYNYEETVYKMPWCRGDSYFLGMALYMTYENVIKQIKSRSYAKKRSEENVMSTAPPADNQQPAATEESPYSLQGLTSWVVDSCASLLAAIVAYPGQRIEGFLFFHKNANWNLIVAVWCAWAFALFFAMLGLRDILYPENDSWISTWWYDAFDDLEFDMSTTSYALFICAAGAVSLLFLSMEGTLFPISW
jgi:hypothetical protein